MAPTPTRSIRIPPSLRERLLERAQLEGRTFSNLTVRLVERGLAATEQEQDEVERLADIARELLHGRQEGEL